jgi:3-methyladenine DNA glycosylase AlkD
MAVPQKKEKGPAPRRIDDEVKAALKWLEQKSTRRDRENLKRFGINATNAVGVSMANIQVLGKRLGRSHELAAALWDTRCYEARLLASFVDEPERVTPAQMDRWCRDFDNWGVCDTVCFFLFDRTPHAWGKVEQWSQKREEFVKRAAFALLASLAGHDKQASDAAFLKTLPLIERAATDDRNFVMKGVSWALRRIGTRGPVLKNASLAVARRLSESEHGSARWIARETIKDLSRPAKTRK